MQSPTVKAERKSSSVPLDRLVDDFHRAPHLLAQLAVMPAQPAYSSCILLGEDALHGAVLYGPKKLISLWSCSDGRKLM